MTTRELLDQLARAESAFLRRTFVAPVTEGARVRVRVEGICWQLSVLPADYEGWTVLQAINATHARALHPAGLRQVCEYLELFPAVSMLLCERRHGTWWALLAEGKGEHSAGERLVPVSLVGEAQLFDTVRARWDGVQFLYERRHPRRDPAVAAYLREALAEKRRPDELAKPTLTLQERRAYGWQCRLAELELPDTPASGLRAAVAHAAGEFRGFVERGERYTVTFSVDGETHTAAVRKRDLSVLTAGICLSGEDEKFDLSSLVSVIRERPDGPLADVGVVEDLPAETYREVPGGQRRRFRG